MTGIYIHIPFCKQACYYCDFHFSTNPTYTDEMIRSICKELELQKEYLGEEPVSTIYLGGGTPSLLSKKNLEAITNTISKYYSLVGSPEFTMEINPEDVSKEKLSEWEKFEINRISMGIQSFDDNVLKYMNRLHTADTAKNALRILSESLINNYNLDLIYGIPSFGVDRWQSDLENAIAFGPNHISAYALTVEPGTVFGKWAEKGKLKIASEDFVASEFELLHEFLSRENYVHYEVSNFALPGFESKHNTGYWRDKKYLGVGPSAHSYNHESRQYNISNNALYIKALKENRIPFTLEVLNRKEQVNDYLLTSIRTIGGISLKKLKQKWTYDIVAEHNDYLREIINKGLAEKEGPILRLTPAGYLLADKIASDLFL